MSRVYRCEIGGVTVWMTRPQVQRWNDGCTTDYDLRTVCVHCALTNQTMSLRRATNAKLEYDLANMMRNMPANIVQQG